MELNNPEPPPSRQNHYQVNQFQWGGSKRQINPVNKSGRSDNPLPQQPTFSRVNSIGEATLYQMTSMHV